MSILDLPEQLFFIDSIEMDGCVFKGKEKELTTISKQIWEGSHSIFSFIFGNKQCVGVKDIVDEWTSLGTQTILFHIPQKTLQEVRKHLIEEKGTQLIVNEIETYILSKIHNNLPDTLVYSLNNKRDNNRLSNLFDIESLKKELERTNTSNTHQIYMIGLPFKPYGEDIDFYLNGEPIVYQGGTLLGSSKIFSQRIKKGTILVTSDDGIRVNFFDTNNYTSTNENINYDLKALDFTQDNIHFELDKRRPTIMESLNTHQLFFSRLDVTYKESLVKEKKGETPKSLTKRGAMGINLESFYIPFTDELEILHLLLIRKEGKNLLVGGEYHSDLSSNVLAQITLNMKSLAIKIRNRSTSNLVFEKYTNNLWRLNNIKEEKNQNSSDNLYTNILDNSASIENFSPTGNQLNKNANILTIEPNKIAQLETEEIEFNDSNLYRDNSGLWIRYTQFEIQRFDKEIQLNRTLYKIAPEGAILDAFVKYDSSSKSFLYGAKVQKGFSDILSRAISSKPIKLTYRENELTIENQLDSNHYIVQVLSSSQKYILEDEHKSIVIKKSDLKKLKIDIINKIYRNRPLIRFGLIFQG